MKKFSCILGFPVTARRSMSNRWRTGSGSRSTTLSADRAPPSRWDLSRLGAAVASNAMSCFHLLPLWVRDGPRVTIYDALLFWRLGSRPLRLLVHGCAWFPYLSTGGFLIHAHCSPMFSTTNGWKRLLLSVGSFMFIHPRQENHACQSEQCRGTNGLSTDLAQDPSPKSFPKPQCDDMIINNSNAQNELLPNN